MTDPQTELENVYSRDRKLFSQREPKVFLQPQVSPSGGIQIKV